MTTRISLLVSACATVLLPEGSVVDVDTDTVTLPSGEKLKFWVQTELYEDPDNNEVGRNLNEAGLYDRGVTVEHDGAVFNTQLPAD